MLTLLLALGALQVQDQGTRGLVKTSERAAPGYTLVAPLSSGETYLVDLAGNSVHSWKSDKAPGHSVFLLENGHLLRAERIENPVFFGGGQGGRLREFDWEGALVWEYTLSDEKRCAHHDFEVLPNGNVLAIAWELRSAEEAKAAGRTVEGAFWPDCVLEIEPVRPNGGKIVWEWHAFDHLLKQGPAAAHPERIDVNTSGAERAPGSTPEELAKLKKLGYVGDEPKPRRGGGGGGGPGGPPGMSADWLHTNGIDYRADLDLVVLSIHNLNEVWVIDHSTTTAEAASSKGGKRGKGGDLLLRWGNPVTHGGKPGERKLSGQHDAQWIASGLAGAGHMLVFNNGGRGDSRQSIVDEVALPLDEATLTKPMDTKALAALEPCWSYTSEAINAGHISGTQRLSNGDTLVTNGETGRLVEVDAKGEVVWEWLNPFKGDLRMGGGQRGGRGPGGPPPGDGPGPRRGPPGAGPGGPGGPGPRGMGDMEHGLFRCDRYAPDFPGLSKLNPKTGEKH